MSHLVKSTIARYGLWLLLVLSFAAQAQEAPKILVLGDSLSAAYGIPQERGWVRLLQKRLAEQAYPHQLINASVSGETSGGALKRLPRLLEEHQPEWLLLELGGNDGLRGYPIEKLRENLKALVRTSREAGTQVLLMGMRIPPNYGSRYAGQFARVFPQVAEECDLPLVEFMLKDVATQPDLMQDDGIHPNAQAQPIILDNIWPQLKAQLEKQES